MTAKASRVSDTVLRVQGTVEGARAFTSDGVYATITGETLQALAGTGENGRIAVNHELFNGGRIASGGEIMDNAIQFDVEVPQVIADYVMCTEDNKEPPGVSLEYGGVVLNEENEIVDAEIVGISFTMPPHKSICSTKEGCKVVTAAASEVFEEEQDTGGIEMSEDTISVQKDEYKELCAQASELAELKAERDALSEELESLKAEKADIDAKASEYAEQLEKFVSEKKEEKLEALSSLIGEEAVESYKDKSLGVIQEAIDVAEFAKKTALASVEVDSGAHGGETKTDPAVEELEKDLKAFLGVR